MYYAIIISLMNQMQYKEEFYMYRKSLSGKEKNATIRDIQYIGYHMQVAESELALAVSRANRIYGKNTKENRAVNRALIECQTSMKKVENCAVIDLVKYMPEEEVHKMFNNSN